MIKRYIFGIITLLVLLVAWTTIYSSTGTAAPLSQVGTCPDITNSLYFTVVYGSVLVDGAAAPVGSVVEARNSQGDVVGCTVVKEIGSYGTLYVYGADNSVSPPVPGMQNGETIIFYVDGRPATSTPTLVWHNDHQVHAINLDVGEITVTPTLTVTVTPSVGVCPVISNTLYFTLVYGSITVDDISAPVGTVVEARNPHGDTVGCFVVTQAGNYGSFYVYGKDTNVNPTIPGMQEGETVVFFINDKPAFANPSLIWAADQVTHQIDLSTTPFTPAPRVTPTITYTCPDVENTLQMTIIYGAVTLDGIPAPVGTIVEARNAEGVTAGCFEVTHAGNYGTLYVYGKDTTVISPLLGMRPGEAIAFYVNHNSATAIPNLTWENDREFHKVDLNASMLGNVIFLPLVLRNFPPPPPDFSLAITPSELIVEQGKSGDFAVSIVGLNGFTDLVSLTVEGLPSNTSSMWIKNIDIPSGPHKLRITTTLGTPIGPHTLQVIGNSNGLIHTANATLQVEAGIPTEDGVVLYEHPGYKGDYIVVTDSDPNLVDDGFNDRVSSLQIIGDYTVTLYSDVYFGGQFSIFTESDMDLRNDKIGNARASSIKIETP